MIPYVSWLVLVTAPAVVAQVNTSIDYCTDQQFDWVTNSMGQSPCVVSEMLSFACGDGYYLAPLSPGQLYSFSDHNNCTCSSIFYSVISACAACQDMPWESWPTFTQGCMITYLTTFPPPIPSNTTVPNWAYLNVSATNNTFNVDAAWDAANNPTITGFGPTRTSATTSTSSALTSASSTPSPSSHSSKTNTGVIAGGVIGGVVGGALITALLFWLYTTRKNHQSVDQTTALMSKHKMFSSPFPSTMSSLPLQPVVPPPSVPQLTAQTPALLREREALSSPSSTVSSIPVQPAISLPAQTPALVRAREALSSPSATNSSTPVQPAVSLPAAQNPYDPDDIPTSSTISRIRGDHPPVGGLLPNAGPYWGQVGQYYHGVGEV